MNPKEQIHETYRQFRNSCGKDMGKCFDFLKKLHEEEHTTKYLVDMKELTGKELKYINTLLQNTPDEEKFIENANIIYEVWKWYKVGAVQISWFKNYIVLTDMYVLITQAKGWAKVPPESLDIIESFFDKYIGTLVLMKDFSACQDQVDTWVYTWLGKKEGLSHDELQSLAIDDLVSLEKLARFKVAEVVGDED